MTDSRYWETGGAVPLPDAKRNCVRWNAREETDLVNVFKAGASIQHLMRAHDRTQVAIEGRLCKMLGVSLDGLYSMLRSKSARKSSTVKASDVWISKDGRQQKFDTMDLDHLVNAVNDCHFRVAYMRARAAQALGGLTNPNLNQATVHAFTNVTTQDVFPAFDALCVVTKRSFQKRYGHSLRDVRTAVYAAWTNGVAIDESMGEAVRWYLRDNQRQLPQPNVKLWTYVTSMGIENEHEFRRMCWNLRLDQPLAWRSLTSAPGQIMKRVTRIPATRLNSALSFSTPKPPVDEDLGFDYDWIPFGAGR